MSSKRPPPSATNATPTKRQRLSSTQTPTPSPEPASSRFPPSTSSLADLDREDDHPHSESSHKFIAGHSSLAGTRRGDGSGVRPPSVEHNPPPEGEGVQVKDEATLQREKEQEDRLIEEASKGVSIDDLELSDVKEVSGFVSPERRRRREGKGRRRVEADHPSFHLLLPFASPTLPDLPATSSSSPRGTIRPYPIQSSRER